MTHLVQHKSLGQHFMCGYIERWPFMPLNWLTILWVDLTVIIFCCVVVVAVKRSK